MTENETSSNAVPIAARIMQLGAELGDRPALTCGARTLSWAELDRTTNQWAHALAAIGVGEGDFVTIALPNSVEHVQSFVACWKLGAVPQPVSPRMPQAELDGVLALARPTLVLRADPPDASPYRHENPESLRVGSHSADPLPVRVGPSWKAPTSGGSTGLPKIIVSGTAGVVDPFAAPFWRCGSDDTMVMPGPMYHNGPIVSAYAGFCEGAHLVLAERFDPAATLALIERHRATWLYLVPTMMSRIWRLDDEVRNRHDLSSLRVVWHLAAPCPPWLKQAWIEWLGAERIWELYGGTEGIVSTTIRGDDWLEHPGSVGRPVVGDLRILDLDGAELPPGEVGEVFMRRPDGTPPTYRYLGAKPRASGEWESIGDIGWLDADGYLYLADRRTDLIVVGGANVYPAEVEAAIDEHPGVASSAVVGLPDDDLGQTVHAIVQPRQPAGLDVDDLRRHLATRLVAYKLPRSIEIVDSPLRDDAGKVRRSQLRADRLVASAESASESAR